MANNNLTNHEVYDSFYASDEERAAFEEAEPQRSASDKAILREEFCLVRKGQAFIGTQNADPPVKKKRTNRKM